MNFYKLSKHIQLLLLLIVFGRAASAQEQLRPLSYNPALQIAPEAIKNNQAAKTTSLTPDTIPFFDDFSYAQKSPYPSMRHWLDSNVFVNMDFGIAPPSLGVATFDGLNSAGYPYQLSANSSVSAQADYLTSRPINLQKKGSKVYGPSDSLYLSFHFQAQGRGDWPEPNDSLCVDFRIPKLNKWVKVWGHKGYNPAVSDTSFYIAMIPIKDTLYLDSAFQFRFRNKATLSGSLDHWHIDYVYLNEIRNVNDTNYNDINFAYKSTPFLKNYYSMPYRQFVPLEVASSFRTYFRNNFTDDRSPTYTYNIYYGNGSLVSSEPQGPFDISPAFSPFKNAGYYTGLQAAPVLTVAPFPPGTFTVPTTFKIEHIVKEGADNAPENDTLVQHQVFSNYYAYDDGTAEVGYYINDYGSYTGMRFTLNTDDTLRAIKIYFDPIIDGQLIQSSSFRLCVWNGGSGSPGSRILKDSLMYPVYYSYGHNFIPTYTLTSCLPLHAGSYFIGFQQVSNQGLNVGFDKNTDHSNALYYDRGFGWQQSTIKGSLMINPVFQGCSEPLVGIKENVLKDESFALYPNPAQNTLFLRSLAQGLENASVSIVSSLGQTVYTSRFENETAIDISNLPNGVYFVYLNGKARTVTPQKLIISR
jgi:hypothetical protein